MPAKHLSKILVIIGPSGSGKSTIAKALIESNAISLTPSWTTRPMRPSEKKSQNPEHVFVSLAEFNANLMANMFLEAVQLFGLPYWYGLPRIERPKNGAVPSVMLRAPLIELINKHYPNHVVYEIHSPIDDLHQRLLSRQEQGDNLGTRMADIKDEIDLGTKLAHRVFINDRPVPEMIKEISKLIEEDMQ
ncbi:MAG: hypothetical protein WCK71_01900 [bacterium]